MERIQEKAELALGGGGQGIEEVNWQVHDGVAGRALRVGVRVRD